MKDKQKTYTGFMTMACEACGKSREFYVRFPITHYDCPCGHRTELFDLMPLYAQCECGKHWKYLTNRTEMQITVQCVNCGSPVDTELNGRGTAFVPMTEPRPRRRGKRK